MHPTAVTCVAAAESLGLNVTTLYGERLAKYRVYEKEGNRKYLFDIGLYSKDTAYQKDYQAKVNLLVEYLYHIEDVSYSRLAKSINTGVACVHRFNLGYNQSKRLVNAMKKDHPMWLERFKEYYDWKYLEL